MKQAKKTEPIPLTQRGCQRTAASTRQRLASEEVVVVNKLMVKAFFGYRTTYLTIQEKRDVCLTVILDAQIMETSEEDFCSFLFGLVISL